MEANEVRFNNWVNFKYKGVDYGNVIIDANYFSHYDNKDYEYTPIPLTEEWLIRFGFVAPFGDTANVRRYVKGATTHLNFTINDSRIYFAFLNSEEIKHVHQLQNLYHALKGKELTINK